MTPTEPAAPATAADPPPTAPPVDPLAEPTFEECIEEANRLHEDVKAGRIDYSGIPRGHFIAYYGGKIHDHDADGYALQHRAAAALGVHWARVCVHYPWWWPEDPLCLP